MIQLLSQNEAERRKLSGARVQCISPYLNPAHVLAPPRHWLEALVNGAFSWDFFRLRYKNLLRRRYRAEPRRFQALLEASVGGRELYLTCHCLGGNCHGELAREFLESVREQHPHRAAREAGRSAAPGQVAVRPVAVPPSREWARSGHPGLALAALIEDPRRTSSPS